MCQKSADTNGASRGLFGSWLQARVGQDALDGVSADVVMYSAPRAALFLVESGGPRAEVERYSSSLNWMQVSVKVRCGTVVTAILASRTCNRW